MPAQGVVNSEDVVNAASAGCSGNVVETVLVIWREVLSSGPGALDADSNFFLCGGDSLDLMRVLVRVRERLGVALDLRDVGSFSTPRRMAQWCTRIESVHRAASDAAPDSPRSVTANFVCSTGQHALWLAEQVGGGCGLYNTAVALHFTGALQVPILARALSLLLRQHEVLRCSLRYDSRARQLVAHVAAPCEIRLKADFVAPDTAQQRLLAVAAQPFDLEQGPLWRLRLLRVGTQRWTLLLCVHHAVTDGWSGHVLLHDLAENYRALLDNPAPQPRQPQGIDTEFRRWCLRQPDAAAAGDMQPGVNPDWWHRYLAGADRLPSWPPTGTARWPFSMALEQCVLPRALQAGIRRVSREQGLRPAALFLTALRLTVLDLGGIPELCIGMPANVRDSSAQDVAVGYFVNLLVLRERVDAARAGFDAVRRVQQSLDEALRRRMVPFAQLARALKPVPRPSGNVWCDVLFAFQNLPHAQPDFGGVGLRTEALTLPHGQHPLKVEVLSGAVDVLAHASEADREGKVEGKVESNVESNVESKADRYVCRIEYARECLDQRGARALLEAFQRRIAALLGDPARSS